MLGLGELRLAPREFWTMTQRELVALTGAMKSACATPPTRAELHALMSIYPDKEQQHE